MFSHILKIAWRNLLRSKVFTVINILGLSIGIASFLLIALLIQELFRIDQFHEKNDRIYAVYSQVKEGDVVHTSRGTSSLLGPAIKSNYSQSEEVVRVAGVNNFIFHFGNKHVESSGYMTDAGFLNTFSFPLLKGDPETALRDPGSIVLKESFARKLFGTAEPLGQTIRVDSNAVFRVSGI